VLLHLGQFLFHIRAELDTEALRITATPLFTIPAIGHPVRFVDARVIFRPVSRLVARRTFTLGYFMLRIGVLVCHGVVGVDLGLQWRNGWR
jgi:hypothetical protein